MLSLIYIYTYILKKASTLNLDYKQDKRKQRTQRDYRKRDFS